MRILTVVDYDEMWPALFESERTLLQMTLGKVISRIHHIGSTSVPGLSAKPVIDILIEVANLEELDSLNQAMEGVGYTVRGENGILNRRYFTKGGNQRSHHIHAFATGDAQIIKHLAFRDYLIKHNDVAIQYALMKKSAMLLCENDSHRYSIYKADFIQKHLRMALIDAGHIPLRCGAGLAPAESCRYRSTDWASYGRTTPASASRNDNHAIRRHHELSRRNLARPRGRSAPGLCLVMTKLMNPFCVKGSSSL